MHPSFILDRDQHSKHDRRDRLSRIRRRRFRRALFEPLEDRRLLAAIQVSTLDDIVDPNDGVISLREAIAIANTNGQPDVIAFDESLFAAGAGTVTLDLGELAITDSVTISGPGADQLVIDAAGLSRIFNVDDGDSGIQLSVQLGGVTLTGGLADDGDDTTTSEDDYGGAIYSVENLLIVGAAIEDNQAAVWGGGIANLGTLTVRDSTLAANRAINGGGIQNALGTASIVNTTISGNVASDSGGGLGSFLGAVILANATVTANTGGGIFKLLAGGTVTIHNTIVAGNQLMDGSPSDVQSSLEPQSSHNLIGDPATAGGLTHADNGNVLGRDDGAGRALLPVGAILNPQLTFNGGFTRTHALSHGSPAIDAGDNALTVDESDQPLTTDQRQLAFSRINNSTIDIGAFESQMISGVPETLIVTTADDEFDADRISDLSDLSLREALAIANASTGVDTITFHPTVSGSGITLSPDLGSLVISDSVTIQGSESIRTIIDGSGQGFRVFDIVAGEVTFDRLTIQGGQAPTGQGGGGIRNGMAGTLTLVDSTVSGSSAKWGGGVYNRGTLVLNRSTLSGNSADYGGGIYNHSSGSVTLTNSTVSGNTAQIGGGGLYNFGTMALTHVTVAGSAAPSNRGGGIWNAGTASLNNSIVIGSTSGGDIAGPLDVLGASNLVGDPNNVGGLIAANGNILGRDDGAGGRELLPTNAVLQPLAFNGLATFGLGFTETHALVQSSPAIDAGNDALAVDPSNVPLNEDQRGRFFRRLSGDAVDIGALESQSSSEIPPQLVVTTLADENDVDPLADLSDLSLREALAIANAAVPNDDDTLFAAIKFDASLFDSPQILSLSLGELPVTRTISIQGPGQEMLTIDGQNQSRLFNVDDGDDTRQTLLDMQAMTLSGGLATDGDDSIISDDDHGGAIRARDSLSLVSVTLMGNRAAADGGAIWQVGNGQFVDLFISLNESGRHGGAIMLSGDSSATLNDTTIINNNAGGNGGAMAVSDQANLLIPSGTFNNNEAAGGGGAIWNTSSGFTTMLDTILSQNVAGGDGGGLFNALSPITVANSTLSGNRSSGDGGGIYNAAGGTLQLINGTVFDNTASSSGGGVANLGSSKLSNTIVAENRLAGGGRNDLVGSVDPTSSHNLIGVDVALSGIANGLQGNQIGTATSPVDPLLGPLADNGGSTPTHDPLPLSPVIDAGDKALATVTLFDQTQLLQEDQRQRGFPRVFGGQIDIGAVERQPPPIVVTTLDDHLDADPLLNPNDLSLREALQIANTNTGPQVDSITFDKNLFSLDEQRTLTLTLGQLSITDPVTITGPGRILEFESIALVIDANQQSRVFDISSAAGDVALVGFSMSDGRVANGQSGGAIRSLTPGTLSLSDMEITDNRVEFAGTTSAVIGGGGIFADGGDLIIANSNISSNEVRLTVSDAGATATARGGGIDWTGGSLRITTTSISDNFAGAAALAAGDSERARSDGGGLRAAGVVELSGVTVVGNALDATEGGFASDGRRGTGILITSGQLTMDQSSIGLNSGGQQMLTVGAVQLISGDLSIAQSFVSQNDATGIFVQNGRATIGDSTISNNGSSGVVHPSDHELMLRQSTISGNTAAGILAARAGIEASEMHISGSTIYSNGINLYIGKLPTSNADVSLRIENSIVASGVDPQISGDIQFFDLSPVAVTISHSLIGNNEGSGLEPAALGSPDANGNLIGTDATPIDPLLGPLVDNGGFGIATHLPRPGSPVIDVGSNPLSVTTNDQRGDGFPRINDGDGDGTATIDMGAVEFPSAPMDYGDAPTAADTGFAGDYPVTLAQDGARHVIPATGAGLRLGSLIDADADGQPDDQAGQDGSGGDDNADVADEDGVFVVASILATSTSETTSSFEVIASGSGKLDGWIDFNRDGSWGVGEQIFNSVDVVSGSNLLSFSVPAGAAPGDTGARFRLSTAGGLSPTGAAADGEVEDYIATILDGDAAAAVAIDLIRVATNVRVVAGELVVSSDLVDLFRAPLSAIAALSLDGIDGLDNQLTVNVASEITNLVGGLTFSGGTGSNALQLTGDSVALDLRGIASGFGSIEFVTPDATTAVIDGPTVANLAPTGPLQILGGREDVIQITDASSWRLTTPISREGRFFVTASNSGSGGNESIEADLGRPWQNFLQPSDINNDGDLRASDALRIINELARETYFDPVTKQLDDPASVGLWPGIYFDQNGDGNITALDALRVINQLARAGETESISDWITGQTLNLINLAPILANASRNQATEIQTDAPAIVANRSPLPISFERDEATAGNHSNFGHLDPLNTDRQFAADHWLSDDEFLEDLVRGALALIEVD